jgi:hypothetical protein
MPLSFHARQFRYINHNQCQPNEKSLTLQKTRIQTADRTTHSEIHQFELLMKRKSPYRYRFREKMLRISIYLRCFSYTFRAQTNRVFLYPRFMVGVSLVSSEEERLQFIILYFSILLHCIVQ